MSHLHWHGGPNLFRPYASIHPRNEQMVEYISTLADQADAVACHGLDQALGGLFTELLSHPCRSPGQQAGRMTDLRVGIFPALDDRPQSVEHLGVGVRCEHPRQ
jgi:hypothetical protein